MNTLLIGNGYWGQIVKKKLQSMTNLVYVANSKDNIDSILENYDVDYVFVCTPTNTHYEIVKKCIKHKKNVFCEKPFTGVFELANELFDLATKNNVKLFVDNIFLYREETLSLKKENINKIKFIWNKYEKEFKENLFNTLLYHDLYLLSELTDIEWCDFFCKVSDEKLLINLKINTIDVEFSYNRGTPCEKEKKIIIDQEIINYSNPLNDPLSDLIELLRLNKIDFETNKITTLKTINFLNKIQNECILHTSGNAN